MANIDKFLPKLFKVEGGFTGPNGIDGDAGGATNKGITIAVFRKYYGADKSVEDLKNITTKQATRIYKDLYWDKCKCDDIKSQSVAELFCDFAVNSGVKTATKKVQRLIGVKDDGVAGAKTVAAINGKNPHTLFNELYDVRVAFYKQLVANKPSQGKFLKGWLKRLTTYTFEG